MKFGSIFNVKLVKKLFNNFRSTLLLVMIIWSWMVCCYTTYNYSIITLFQVKIESQSEAEMGDLLELLEEHAGGTNFVCAQWKFFTLLF